MSDEHVMRPRQVPAWVNLSVVVLAAVAVRASVSSCADSLISTLSFLQSPAGQGLCIALPGLV